ncbi:hypothetical protein BFT35_13100 [Thermoanaerobacterium thermosaccharolyticum]|uniref:S8 family peptidase n=1 Tax=Thermoanaerobacterium thermosaccharolyticum TaxID=1517 RepID=UPI000C085866|nr:S8/S53 family peptidase [Thermoanaerobacterium thermosaccharolyticum]KAA5806830.1 S8/S53 family peptidase [Thermoanaerobacterium thermosaccharolyticum]PHO06096.1 hypothetical protein BFT35_13100 [Thermoanaerobacterium thermosaccharolyticum]
MDILKTPVKIALIDSGIDINIPKLNNSVLESICININDDGINIIKDAKINHIHGTIISLIIKHICNNVQFININILNNNLRSDGRVLIHALDRAISYKPDIINLSLGTNKYKYKYSLNKLINICKKNNIIVISATDNEGHKCYPAYLKNVIGVRASKIPNKIYYSNRFIYAPSTAMDILKAYGLEDHYEGTSISTAYVTGQIANLLQSSENIGKDDILRYLPYLFYR